MKNFNQYIKENNEFFEGFTSPTLFQKFGDFDEKNLNMDDNPSNLLILKMEDKDEINKIIRHFEYLQEDYEYNSMITLSQNDDYLMIMTFTDSDCNTTLHELVCLKKSIQLLDDSTSTNDCVRACEYLTTLKDDGDLTDSEFQKIKELLVSKISTKGFNMLKTYLPDFLETNKKSLKL